MTSFPTARRRRASGLRRLVRTLLLPALLLVLTGLAVGALAPPGSAAPTPLRSGAGYHVPGGFAGYYLTRTGVKVYCIDPGKRAPSSVNLTTVQAYRGMSARTAAELGFALRTWGDAHTRAQAAVESQLVNTIAGNDGQVRRRARSLPRSIGAAVAARLRVVRARTGPYALWVGVPRATLPGQTARGGVRVASARVGVPGVVVRLTAGANVTLPRAVRTDGHGRASFAYTVTGAGPVTVHAVAEGLAPTWFVGSHPGAGQQRMVTWGRSLSASASTTFEGRPGGFSHRYACTTTCDGHPHTTLHVCAAPGAFGSRVVYRVGASTRVVSFGPGAHPRCSTIDVVLADRDRVSAFWQFAGPHGWTAPVVAAGAFVIDCPAVPPVDLALHYDCAHAGVSAAVANPTAHVVVLVVSGAARARVLAAPGAVARFAVVVPCGRAQTYRVQAGVTRAGGQVNWGATAAVTTPGAARQP